MRMKFRHFLCVAALVARAGEIPDMPTAYRADPAATIVAAAQASTERFPDADTVMVDDRLRDALLVAGAGVAHLGAQAALETFLLVDLILGANKVNGLGWTFAGAVVAAGTDPSVNYKHGIHPFHEFFTHLS